MLCSYLEILDETAHWTGGLKSLLPLPGYGRFDSRIIIVLILSYTDKKIVHVTMLVGCNAGFKWELLLVYCVLYILVPISSMLLKVRIMNWHWPINSLSYWLAVRSIPVDWVNLWKQRFDIAASSKHVISGSCDQGLDQSLLVNSWDEMHVSCI